MELSEPAKIGTFGLDEPDVWPRMKQRYTLQAQVGDEWRNIAEGGTNGHGTKATVSPVTARKFRLTMECANGSPGVAELQLYPAD